MVTLSNSWVHVALVLFLALDGVDSQCECDFWWNMGFKCLSKGLCCHINFRLSPLFIKVVDKRKVFY